MKDTRTAPPDEESYRFGPCDEPQEETVDYDSFDRDAVQYLVSCIVNDTRFYLTKEGLATDIQSRAARYSLAQAEAIARAEMTPENSWYQPFKWQMVRRTPNGAIL